MGNPFPRPGRLWWLFRRDWQRGWKATFHEYFTLPRIVEWSNPFSGNPASVPIHLLTGKNDWLLAAWMLASWFHFTGRNWDIVIHDDGTLPETAATRLRLLFPAARIVPRREADTAMDPVLDRFPHCLAYRNSHPLGLKIFDIPQFTAGSRFAIFDSDLLFFDRPEEIVRWVEDGSEACWFNRDVADSSLISRQEAAEKLGIDLWQGVNSGLCLLAKDAIDLDFCERCLRETAITKGHIWRIEQTLFAACASRLGRGGMLSPLYEVSLGRHAAPGCVARHYVGAVRNLFYEEGLSRLRSVILPSRRT